MAKFIITAEAIENEQGWGIQYEMEHGDLKATKYVFIGDPDMSKARASLFNRTRQHGKAGLKQIGQQAIPNMFVKFA